MLCVCLAHGGEVMDQYFYCADVYCEECADKIKAAIAADGGKPSDAEDEKSFDSDEWPKGPYSDQESDCAEHCAYCHVFFENPLTSEGYCYVREKLDAVGQELGDNEVLEGWASYYGFEWYDNEDASGGHWASREE